MRNLIYFFVNTAFSLLIKKEGGNFVSQRPVVGRVLKFQHVILIDLEKGNFALVTHWEQTLEEHCSFCM